MITDARALYDAVHHQESSCLGMEERRTGMEALLLKQTSARGAVQLKCAHSHAMVANGLTKSDRGPYMLLRTFVQRSQCRWLFGERFPSVNKRLILGINIFEESHENDRQ